MYKYDIFVFAWYGSPYDVMNGINNIQNSSNEHASLSNNNLTATTSQNVGKLILNKLFGITELFGTNFIRVCSDENRHSLYTGFTRISAVSETQGPRTFWKFSENRWKNIVFTI